MKSHYPAYYTVMTYLTGLFAIASLGFSILFCGFSEVRPAMLALSLSVTLGLLSLLYKEIGKPKNWSIGHTRNVK